MKQLYKIGIIVAVMLLVLLGLSKLNNTSPDPVTPEVTPPVEEEVVQEDVDATSTDIQTNNEKIMSESQGNTTVVLKTNKGDITVELFTEKTPITAGNFLKLAKENFYDGVKFHRVIDSFMIQGGDPLSKDDSKQGAWGTGGPGYAIKDEFVTGLSNSRGTLSMANSGPNTGGSQFFINTVDNTFLDGKHAVFGTVVSGMEVVDAISKVEKDARDVPFEAIVINDILVQE